MKILVIRFSSIGDIVMTTPVIRCLKQQLGAEIHVATKKVFATILEQNPYVDSIISLDANWTDFMSELKKNKYDHIVDLHNNLRSRRVASGLRQKSLKINKLSLHKQVLIHTGINNLPDLHVSERGLEVVNHLGVVNDNEGMDYFIDPLLPQNQPFRGKAYVALALATAHETKNIPVDLLSYIVENCPLPMVFLGGPKDASLGISLEKLDPTRLQNKAGECSLAESAILVKNADYIIAGDTGILHIAAAIKRPTISIWGATIPEYGVFPYYGKYDIPHYIHEIDMKCRPCSKHGSASCPKKHFNCMNLQDKAQIKLHMELLAEKVKN